MKLSTSRMLRWARQILFGVMFLWGTFAAIVAFAVRYEIGMFAPSVDELGMAPRTTEAPAFPRPKVTAASWNQLLDPNSIEHVFMLAASGRASDAFDSVQFNYSRFSLTLDYKPSDSTAVWNAVYRVGCGCPNLLPEETPRFEASIDPLSGEVLSLTVPDSKVIPKTGDTSTGHTGEEARP